jgi:predicted DNA-binding transcriptional regulator YafY
MPRAERLMELGSLLRSRESTTVEALASELNVSRRTLLRDLASLREGGMPIHGESGPGGGVRMDGDRGMASVHLTIVEIVSLWLSTRLARSASNLPWGEAAKSGMVKLFGSLPQRKARELRALCKRVIVGEPASEEVRKTATTPPPELLRLFEHAFSSRRGLAFQYTDHHGRSTSRRVEPHGLVVQTPVWYILARDLDKLEPRWFRMDRIRRPLVLREVSFVPDASFIAGQLPSFGTWQTLT